MSDYDLSATGWGSDEVQVAQARAGYGIGPEIYDELNPRLLSSPSSLPHAYEEGAYFLAIAARRADYENEEAAYQALISALDRLEGSKSTEEWGIVCSTTGYLCPKGGGLGVLQQVKSDIEMSGLNLDDRARLTAYLDNMMRSLKVKKMILPLALLAIGGGIGYLWWRRKNPY